MGTADRAVTSTAEESVMSSALRDMVVVRPDPEALSPERLPSFIGISGASAGATGISMNLVVIPPSGEAQPHRHLGYETAVYLLRGQVRVRYGPALAESLILQPGDFLFIPEDMPHQPVNLSTAESALAIVARNDANERESVEVFAERCGGRVILTR
jgi:uncharacterized RmlC-like cupin family protein